jgi:hypothetical protein
VKLRPAFFTALAALLGAAVIYQQVVRRILVPEVLQYVPKESTLLIATGSLESLWNEMDAHFGDVIRDKDRKGFLFTQINAIHSSLREQELKIDSAADLARYGIDPSRGILLAAIHPTLPGGLPPTSPDAAEAPTDESGVEAVLVLPVLDRARFTDSLLPAFEPAGDTTLPGLATGGHALTVTRLNGGWFLVHPEGDWAVLASSLSMLRRSVANRHSNLVHARNSDFLFESVRGGLRRPLLSGPSLFVFWQPRIGLPVRQITGTLVLEKSTVRIDGEAELARGGVRVIEDLFRDPPASVAWNRGIPADVAAALAVHDRELAHYLRTLGRMPTFDRAMTRHFGSLLKELQGVEHQDRLVLAVTGYDDGLPQLGVGVWGDSSALAAAVARVQARLRTERDSAVIAGARDSLRVAAADSAASIPFQSVLGLLAPEPGSLFDRYVVTDGSIRPQRIRPEDLSTSAYTQEYRGITIRYLAPRLTGNDLRFRTQFARLDTATLLSDRYRVATATVGNVLWAAADATELRKLLDGVIEPGTGLSDNRSFRAATSAWSRGDKVELFLNTDRTLTLGLLSAESAVNDPVKKFLMDLQGHPAVSFHLTASEGRRLQFHARMFRPAALTRP